MDQQSLVESQAAGSNVYAFDGKMLIISATSTVFLVVVLLASLHLYARWWLRREAAAAAAAAHFVVLADPNSAADRGLEPAVLTSLPVFTFSSPAPEQGRALLECAVCLSEFEEEETVRLLPRCNHAFHIGCIDMWFHSHSTCPLCRSPVEPADGDEPGSSENVHHTGARRREEEEAMDVKIDVVGPPGLGNDEQSQSSPISTTTAGFLTFKRLLSMGRKSPVGGKAETSGSAAELDLEGGIGESALK